MYIAIDLSESISFFKNNKQTKKDYLTLNTNIAHFHAYLRVCYGSIREYLEKSNRRLAFAGIGKPASGKDRQAEILNDAGVPFLRTSALLDRLSDEHPFNKDYRCKGKLAPAKDIAKIVIDDITERGCPNLLFLNGSPRAPKEAEVLYPELSRLGYDVLPVELCIPDELALKRRLGDLKDGIIRPDAGREAERLKEYADNTYPVFKFGADNDVPYESIAIDDKTEPFDVAFAMLALVQDFVFLQMPKKLRFKTH